MQLTATNAVFLKSIVFSEVISFLCFMKDKELFYHSVYYKAICDAIISKSGIYPRTFQECNQLAVSFKQEGCVISGHTIARFFGILPNRKLYPATLDILVSYLGYSSFSEYINAKDLYIEQQLSSKNDLFRAGPFSLTALEIAIKTTNKKDISDLLMTVNMDHEDKTDLIQFLGSLVRNATNKNEILEILISTENGRRLFFESYVDEDDPNGYFSDALQRFYYQNVQTPNNRLFYFTFLISNAIYHKKSVPVELKEFECLISEVDENTLHFHELSRLTETQLLLNYTNGKLTDNQLDLFVERVEEWSTKFNNHELCWLIARPLKALAFSGVIKEVLTHHNFYERVFDCYYKSKMNSMAEMIIQFIIHAYYQSMNEKLLLFPPLKLQTNRYNNENNARIVLESSVSALYAESKVYDILVRNLKSFTKSTGNTWVLNLLSINDRKRMN